MAGYPRRGAAATSPHEQGLKEASDAPLSLAARGSNAGRGSSRTLTRRSSRLLVDSATRPALLRNTYREITTRCLSNRIAQSCPDVSGDRAARSGVLRE